MPTYVSQEGLENLKQELEHRKTDGRREIADRIAQAKELGDLSENFEYHEAKEQQSLNEARIMELEGMVKDAVLVEQSSGGEIGLGSTFVATTADTEKTFEIVGSSEANPIVGKVSNESPIGMAFIGHREGDDVEVETPGGTTVYHIKEVK